MTELERARVTREALSFILQCDTLKDLYSPAGREKIKDVHDYYERRVLELEAREPKDSAALVERVALLEKAMGKHRHYPSPSKEASMPSSTAVDYELAPMPVGF